jgi:CubicO group peptidase (beta-lactamase class C family)
MDPTSLTARSFNLAPPKPGVDVNHRDYRAAEMPSGNGHGSARALARVYGSLASGGEVDGVRLLSPEAIDRARAEQVFSHDETLLFKTRRSLGFMLPVAEQGDARGEQSFGHAGMGGSLGYADPQSGIGFGYVMNQMWSGTLSKPDPRAHLLTKAVYESLA